MTTITFGKSVKETAKSRRHARRRAAAIERDNLEGVIDAAFGVKTLSLADKRMKAQQRVKSARKASVIASGCSNRVLKAVASPSVREVKEVEFVTRENPEYRKVKTPYGQLTNARQKMRGCCIPLI